MEWWRMSERVGLGMAWVAYVIYFLTGQVPPAMVLLPTIICLCPYSLAICVRGVGLSVLFPRATRARSVLALIGVTLFAVGLFFAGRVHESFQFTGITLIILSAILSL